MCRLVCVCLCFVSVCVWRMANIVEKCAHDSRVFLVNTVRNRNKKKTKHSTSNCTFEKQLFLGYPCYICGNSGHEYPYFTVYKFCTDWAVWNEIEYAQQTNKPYTHIITHTCAHMHEIRLVNATEMHPPIQYECKNLANKNCGASILWLI